MGFRGSGEEQSRLKLTKNNNMERIVFRDVLYCSCMELQEAGLVGTLQASTLDHLN